MKNYVNDFFQQKDCDIHNQRTFFVYKMKIPKKWQILLSLPSVILFQMQLSETLIDHSIG